jgi:hypothetical protein
MKVFSQQLSEETLKAFKDHHEKYHKDPRVNDINLHEIDIRTRIFPHHDAWKYVKEICLRHFPKAPDEEIYANYQRQSMPTFMHVDDYGAFREEETWTIIIPMHTDHRLSVVIFKKKFNDNKELQDFVRNFPYENLTKCNNITKKIHLQHTPYNWKKPEDYLADYLELDGVFHYNLGDYVLFDTSNLHVSSNFKIYPEYKHKDLVQIHIGKTPNKGYNPFYKKN